MNVALIEPYFAGSHKQWCEGLTEHSVHTFRTYSLRGKYWKWRMKGGAIALAESLSSEPVPDVFLVTDMLDLALFRMLIGQHHDLRGTPFILYFHENQLMYPWNSAEGIESDRDRHYAFTNYTSALAADKIWFSSQFQMNGFIKELGSFLRAFPDNKGLNNIDAIAGKSSVVPVGIGPLPSMNAKLKKEHTILWNHRHEHDKNPELFFKSLMEISSEGIDFELVVLGEQYHKAPEIFKTAKRNLSKHIAHWGTVDRETYYKWLQTATIAPVTSNHDFFGISVLESAGMGVVPILPDRLVYPEHFNTTNAFFYKVDSQLSGIIRNMLQTPWQINQDIVSVGRKYEWQQVISAYDDGIENSVA